MQLFWGLTFACGYGVYASARRSKLPRRSPNLDDHRLISPADERATPLAIADPISRRALHRLRWLAPLASTVSICSFVVLVLVVNRMPVLYDSEGLPIDNFGPPSWMGWVLVLAFIFAVSGLMAFTATRNLVHVTRVLRSAGWVKRTATWQLPHNIGFDQRFNKEASLMFWDHGAASRPVRLLRTFKSPILAIGPEQRELTLTVCGDPADRAVILAPDGAVLFVTKHIHSRSVLEKTIRLHHIGRASRQL